MEEEEAAWEHVAPEVVPVQAQGGCWRSLQREAAQFLAPEGPLRWEGSDEFRTGYRTM